MPTPAKVLTILIVLVALGWLVLGSMATQTNRNWGDLIKKQDEQLDQLRGTSDKAGEVTQVQTQLENLKYQISAQQADTVRETSVLRNRMSDLEALVALTREDLIRVQLLARDAEEQVERARRIAEKRTQEKLDTQKAIADAETELEQLRQVDAQLREKRDSLFREFKATLAENKQLVQRLLNAQPSSN